MFQPRSPRKEGTNPRVIVADSQEPALPPSTRVSIVSPIENHSQVVISQPLPLSATELERDFLAYLNDKEKKMWAHLRGRQNLLIARKSLIDGGLLWTAVASFACFFGFDIILAHLLQLKGICQIFGGAFGAFMSLPHHGKPFSAFNVFLGATLGVVAASFLITPLVRVLAYPITLLLSFGLGFQISKLWKAYYIEQEVEAANTKEHEEINLFIDSNPRKDNAAIAKDALFSSFIKKVLQRAAACGSLIGKFLGSATFLVGGFYLSAMLVAPIQLTLAAGLGLYAGYRQTKLIFPALMLSALSLTITLVATQLAFPLVPMMIGLGLSIIGRRLGNWLGENLAEKLEKRHLSKVFKEEKFYPSFFAQKGTKSQAAQPAATEQAKAASDCILIVSPPGKISSKEKNNSPQENKDLCERRALH